MELKISDLMDDLGDPGIPIASRTVASASQIKELTMKKIGQTTPVRKPARRLLVLLAAVLAIAALAGSAVAGYYYDGWFQNFFAGQRGDALSENQLAILESSVVELNLSDTDAGYTVTLESVFSDGNSIYLKLLATAPEGTVLESGYYTFGRMDGDIPQQETPEGEVRGVTLGWERVTDEDPADNVAPMMLSVQGSHISTNVADPTWRFTFADLRRRPNDLQSQEPDVTIAEGQWSFEFVLPETATAEERELVAEPIRITGQAYDDGTSILSGQMVDVTLTSFCLRSMGATMIYEFPEGVSPEGLKFDPLNVVLKDGTVVETHLSTSTSGDTYIRHTIHFDAPIALADVACVEFPGGVKLDCSTE